MYIWSRRHQSRYFYAGVCLLVLIIFLCTRAFKSQTDGDDGYSNRPRECDQRIIRRHFMHDRSPQDFFEQNPVQPPFTYELSNENFCSTVKPHAIVFAVSKSSSFHSRNAIRRTWGNFAYLKKLEEYSHLDLKLLFLVDIDEAHILTVSLEQTIYHDIVQVRLPQYYTLSTYRDMAILHWTDTYCPQTLVTVKTDDDIFLNTYLLGNIVSAILSNTTNEQSKLECNYADPLAIVYGVKLRDAQVVRQISDPIVEGDRYIVTNDEYPCVNYPHYMSGFGYIVNQHARSKLLCTFFRDRKPFHMSDVYITGILPEYIGIQRKHLGLIISYQSSHDCEDFFSQNDPDVYACASSLHYSNTKSDVFERFNAYWRRIHSNRLLYLNRKFPRLLSDE